MKKALIALIFISSNVIAIAQTETSIYKSIAERFQIHYNANKFDSIFVMFSQEMRQALPRDKTIAFFSGIMKQAGRIEKRVFVKYEKGSFALYKTNFEKAIFAVNISVNDKKQIDGLYINPYVDDNLPIIERNITKLKLPFDGEWFTVWGGDTKELNYHIDNRAQKNAFDFIIKDDTGKSYRTTGQTNEDYYAFGKELTAPCDGEIVVVIDGIYDNKPGEMNPYYVPGNTVILKTSSNEYIFFAHFKQNSIKVKQGQYVKKGDILGLCGNSGNSSEPHLHFHLQNSENMNIATGIKCYFDKIIVNGKLLQDYSPIQSEIVRDH